MAKVKKVLKRLVSTTPYATKDTPPSKTINGKVRKVRVNVKNLKLQVKPINNESLLKSKESINIKNPHESAKTRLFVVKLRRAQIKDSSGLQNNTKTSDTTPSKMFNGKVRKLRVKVKNLKLQTKPINNESVLKSKESINIKNSHETAKPRLLGVKLRRAQIKDSSGLQNNTLQAQCKYNDKGVIEISKQNEKDPKKVVDLKSNESQTVIPVLDAVKRNNFRKLSLNKSAPKHLNQHNDEKSANYKATSKDNAQKQIEFNTVKCTQNKNKTETATKLTLAKDNNLTKFKHVQGLSLEKLKALPTENTTNLEITQFEPQQNSTLHFEPPRNSTLLEFGFTKNKNKRKKVEENNNEEEKENSSPKSNSSSHNFANKSQEIENLLNSLDDDNDENIENNTNIVQENQNKNSNKPNKFFHRHEKNLLQNVGKDVEGAVQINCPSKTNGAKKKRRSLLKKRSSLVKRDNVYEFLSQSQTSDSDCNKHIDPAADIIKRLIAQGRVRVATTCKGKGRPILKRKAANKQQVKKVKQLVTAKKEKQLKNVHKYQKNIEDPIDVDDHFMDNIDPIDMDDHFMDNFDHDEPSPDNENNMEQQPQVTGVGRLNTKHHHISDQEGTFSRLARSVLINQAGHSDLKRQKAQRLLEMAKKYVSTPKYKKASELQAVLHSDLSPIANPPHRTAGNASPWRVDEDALPRVFNFNRSSGNLPSFSSDFIPSTPRKEKQKNETILQQQSTTTLQPHSPIHTMEDQNSKASLPPPSPLPYTIENDVANPTLPSVLSSFSSNDSNGENMPPPKAAHENCNNDNDNIFNLKQLPNPRRTLNYRSPLKAINILEVVHLPPYKPPNKTLNSKGQEIDNFEMFGFEDDLINDSCVAERSSAPTTPQKTPIKSDKRPTEDLFGFEDFLTQTDFSIQESSRDDVETSEHRNKTIHDNLKELRKLRPKDNELQMRSSKENTGNPLKTIALFNEGTSAALDVDGMRQRGIKEMFSSTMIPSPKPSTSREALEQMKKRNLRDIQKPNFIEDSNLSELFKDPEPEQTFNENDSHRTYIRHNKRKRRLKENKFVMYLESDESGDEQDCVENHSHETDTSSEKAPKKKRQRKEPKDKPEMTEFIKDFNEMCKEVDSYELIVERCV